MMNRRRSQSFTLVELLVGMVVALILIAVMLAMLNQVTMTVKAASSKLNAFQSAQDGFDIMTQRLSDATLNTYYDYATNSNGVPSAYLRRSDLHFYIGNNGTSYLAALSPAANANSGHSIYFQAPEGYSNGSTYANSQSLMNACGYFVAFGSETNYWPTLFTAPANQTRYRYRLMQAIQSTENNGVYADIEPGGTVETSPTWITPLNNMALPIAENVILLVIWPREDISADAVGNALSTDYQYNSRQGFPLPASATSGTIAAVQSEQMPPILQLTVVAIDEASATRLQSGTTPPTLIETALHGKFTDVTKYALDMAALESALVANHIRYQVLTSSVTMRESKWSSGL